MANCLDMQKDSKKAIKYYKKAVKLNKKNYLIPFNMGVTYTIISDMENAILSFKKALTLNPLHSSSHLFLSLFMKIIETM